MATGYIIKANWMNAQRGVVTSGKREFTFSLWN